MEKEQSYFERMVKRLKYKSQNGVGDVKQGGLFLPPKVMSVKLTDVRGIPWDGKKRQSQNRLYQKR